jgi:hypothetical protein
MKIKLLKRAQIKSVFWVMFNISIGLIITLFCCYINLSKNIMTLRRSEDVAQVKIFPPYWAGALSNDQKDLILISEQGRRDPRTVDTWTCADVERGHGPLELEGFAVAIVEAHADIRGVRVPSLEQAMQRVAGSSRAIIYLRSGIYRITTPLELTAADNLAIRACPGETPVLEGSAGSPTLTLRDTSGAEVQGLIFSGTAPVHLELIGARDCVITRNIFLHGNSALLLDHSTGNRLESNLVVEVAASALELRDQSNSNLVTNNIVDGVAAPETYGGGIFLHGVFDNRISHNLIQNTVGFGIGIVNWDQATINVGNIVEYNLLRETARSALDSGAVYVLGRSGVDTQMVIAGNEIDRVGAGGQHAVGIYLDDSTSGAVVTRNVVRGLGSDALEIHGGSDNLIENNLLDLGGGRPSAVLFQAAPADTNPLNKQTDNVVRRNIILSANPDPKLFAWLDGGHPLISNNFYVNPASALPLPGTPAFDIAPIQANPELARDASKDGYAAIQAAAGAALAFEYIDTTFAGPKPSLSRP